MSDTVPVLIGTAGLVQGESFLLASGTAVVIGRSRSCDISLRRTPGYMKAPPDVRDADHDFNTVSRRHAEFRLETGEFQVVDVGSLNGTYVNREPVDSAVLANGDEVQIGKFRLVFLTGPKSDDA